MSVEEPLAFRDTEMFALARAVGAHRVVVVTGPPGIGKSALANAFAHPKRRGKTEPSTFCKLEGARTMLEAVHEITRALGLTAPPGADAQVLAERVGRVLVARRRVRLVLDDADRCRAELAKLITTWLRDAPSASFVVTARGKLGVPGEHRLELGPLEIPEATDRDPDVLARVAAVQLFERRAATVRPGFRVTQANAKTVATIVRKLEGVPLAIELCASRMLALSERDIVELLTERLDLLEDEAGARSLRSAFALSWEELDDEDALLLAACSCFRGGFLLDAACAMATEGPSGSTDRIRVARALERLVDASLVRVDDGEERRYSLLGTLRAFAAEKLSARGPAEVARYEERHARHYAELRRRRPPLGIDALAVERKNIVEACDRLLRVGDPRAASAAISLAPMALARGPLAPFIDRVTQALALEGLVLEDRAELLMYRGLGLVFQGRRDEGLSDLRAAREDARRAGSTRITALATSKTAMILGLKGNVDEALALFGEALLASAASGEDRTQGVVRKDLANVLAEAGRNDEAVVELARARTFLHAAGDAREEGFVLMMLGSRFVDEGRLVEARRDSSAAIELLRKAGDRRSEAWALSMISLVDAEEGDTSNARRQLDAAIAIVRDVGDEHTEGLLLGFLGNVALEQGVLDDAESAYRDALVLLTRAADQASEGWVTAAAAVVEHALGRVPAARDGFARARSLLAHDGRAARREALEILATVLDPESPPPPAPTDRHELEEIRFARRVLGAVAGRAGGPPSRRELVIASDGSWVRKSTGELTKLGVDRPIARVMHRLALERVRHPGRPVPPHALVRAGWPDERVLPAAAKNRLHVTIARLRRVVLEGSLLHDNEGYFLDPKESARLADASESP